MKVVFLLQLVWLLSANAAAVEEAESDAVNLRRRAEEGDEPKGFFSNIVDSMFGDVLQGFDEDDHDINDLGAFVFELTFNDTFSFSAATPFDSNAVTLKPISQNGLNGDKWNRYAWSSALDNDEDLYIGTFNANMDYWNMTKLYISVLRAPLGMKRQAGVDAFLRWFHGAPIFDSDGAQVLKRNRETGQFEKVFQAPKDFVGFRSLTNYNGNIYAGSTNGPDSPTDMSPYDFKFYGEGMGSRVFTNAGGEFHMLDDQGNLDAYDKSIRKMCVSSYSNRLFIGTETHECAKVLIYDEAGNSWKKIQKTNEEDCKISVSECLDIGDGKMLIGTWQSLGSALYVIDEKNNDEMTKVNLPNLWYHLSCGVMELTVFNDQLYVGLLSFPRGFALMRTPMKDIHSVVEVDWELITGNGFAREQREQLGARVSGNEYPWSSAVINGVYVIGTMTISQRGISTKSSELLGMQPQLWATKNGKDWTLVKHNDQPGFLFGYRTMQVTKDQKTLYIGSSSNLYKQVDKDNQFGK